MPEPISFVASDDLADWLRDEADRRALTVPATVQQVLAEAYREQSADGALDGADVTGAADSAEGPSIAGSGSGSDDSREDELAALADEVASQGVHRDALDRRPDAWTMEERAGESYYVVELPDGERRFHSTRAAAADTVADAYEDGGRG